MPRLSIVLATFNAAGTVERLFASLSAQTFRDFELIVVDGGSTDGTVEIIKRHAGSIAYWHSRPDHGIYDAWNQALSKAGGEYISFLGADDTWSDKDALKRVFDAIGNSTYDLISSRGIMVSADGTRPLMEIGQPWNFRRLRRRMTICHPGALHNRHLFAKYGLFDSRFRIAGDYEFMLRLPESTRSLFIDTVTVLVCDGGISRRRRVKTLNEYWEIQSRSQHVGLVRATLCYLDRCWRIPVARILRIPY